MFFYSRGVYKELLQHGSLYAQASAGKPRQNSSVISLRLTGKPAIFKVLTVSRLSKKKRVPGDDFADFTLLLRLSDDRDTFMASVDTAIEDQVETGKTDKSWLEQACSSGRLCPGSVLLLTECVLQTGDCHPKVHMLKFMCLGYDGLTKEQSTQVEEGTWSKDQEEYPGAELLNGEADQFGVHHAATPPTSASVTPQVVGQQDEQFSFGEEAKPAGTEQSPTVHVSSSATEGATEMAEQMVGDEPTFSGPFAAIFAEFEGLMSSPDDEKLTQAGVSSQTQVFGKEERSCAASVGVEPEAVEGADSDSEEIPCKQPVKACSDYTAPSKQTDDDEGGQESGETVGQTQGPSALEAAADLSYDLSDYVTPKSPVKEAVEKRVAPQDPQASHSISHLTSKLNNSFWSFKARLTNRSPVKEFENRKTGARNRFMRLQFQDQTGIIEAVLFGDMCQRADKESLEVGKSYLVSCGKLSFSKLDFRLWKAASNVSFDLHVDSSTKFQLLVNEVATTAGPQQTASVDLPDQACSSQARDEKAELGPGGYPKRYPNLYKLDRLCLCAAKALVNTFAVVIEVGPVNAYRSNSFRSSVLSLRNIRIVDQTKTEISVAFWGKQADDFSYPVGTMLFFKQVEVSNYRGVSLSVTRSTGFIDFAERDDSIPFSHDLRQWWLQNAKFYTDKDSKRPAMGNNKESDTKQELMDYFKRKADDRGEEPGQTAKKHKS